VPIICDLIFFECIFDEFYIVIVLFVRFFCEGMTVPISEMAVMSVASPSGLQDREPTR
jgi:hypothetical protein